MTALRRLPAVASAVLALLCGGGIAHARATPRHGDFAGRVAIGDGRSLFLMCRGIGRPTVLLEAGLRNRGDIWSTPTDESDKRTMVYQGVSRLTRVCAYDRPGTTLGPDEVSRSTPVPMPRTTTDAASDLRRLLRAARLPGQAQTASPLRRLPVVVLSHVKPFELPAGFPPDFSPVLEQAWRTIQDQLAHLVPGAQHIIATHSGHYIQLDQPGLVRAAIKRVIRAVREGRRTVP